MNVIRHAADLDGLHIFCQQFHQEAKVSLSAVWIMDAALRAENTMKMGS